METAERGRPFAIAICGVKNSGKTTCLEKLVTELKSRGYRTAVVKHDGHDFEADVPGTDSFRMQQAGADATAVFSTKRMMIYEEKQVELTDVLERFLAYDIVLVEGCKEEPILKFEIVRDGNSNEPVSNPQGLVGILTNIGNAQWANEYGRIERLELNDIQKLADKIIAYKGKENGNGNGSVYQQGKGNAETKCT